MGEYSQRAAVLAEFLQKEKGDLQDYDTPRSDENRIAHTPVVGVGSSLSPAGTPPAIWKTGNHASSICSEPSYPPAIPFFYDPFFFRYEP